MSTEIKELLQACLTAFNELPNKRLYSNPLGNSTYELASKCDQVLKELPQEAIYEQMGQYLSSDEENYPRIVSALKRALQEEPNELLDYIMYDQGEEEELNMEFIEVWEKVQYRFSVKEFCDLVGIS